MQGKVKWFSEQKGYGFITDEQGSDFYFGVRDVKGADLPGSGDFVEFDSRNSTRGLRAENVRVVRRLRRDERETCQHCGKRMVPRLVMYQGQVQRSVCPFCGQTHRVINRHPIVTVIYVLLGLLMLAVILNVLSHV